MIHCVTPFDFRGAQCFQVMCVVSISVHILHKFVIYEVTKHGNFFFPLSLRPEKLTIFILRGEY